MSMTYEEKFAMVCTAIRDHRSDFTQFRQPVEAKLRAKGLQEREVRAIVSDARRYSEVFREAAIKMKNLAIRGCNKKAWDEAHDEYVRLYGLSKVLRDLAKFAVGKSIDQIAANPFAAIMLNASIKAAEMHADIIGDRPL